MTALIKEYNLCTTFSVEKKHLLYMGFYPTTGKKHHCQYLASFLNIIVAWGQLSTMIVAMIIDRSNLLKLTETLLYFFTHFTFVCKLLNFQIYGDKIIELEHYLTNPVFYGFSIDQLEVIKRKIRSCDFIATMYRICCAFGIMFYSVAPFLDSTRKNTLPLPGWFPYDIHNYYTVTFILQVVSICLSALGNTAIDILTWKLMSIASAQFEILKNNLENIQFGENSNDIKKVFVKCVDHHRNIISLTKRIQHVFSKGMFLQLFCSIGVICTTGFQMVLIPIPSSQFIFSILYLCTMICQIFTYSWYGHDVMTASEKIAQSLHMSNWHMSDSKTRNLLIIFLENVKRPTFVKAGNFVTLSLVTFTQIMRNSYSYFTVLRRLYEN